MKLSCFFLVVNFVVIWTVCSKFLFHKGRDSFTDVFPFLNSKNNKDKLFFHCLSQIWCCRENFQNTILLAHQITPFDRIRTWQWSVQYVLETLHKRVSMSNHWTRSSLKETRKLSCKRDLCAKYVELLCQLAREVRPFNSFPSRLCGMLMVDDAVEAAQVPFLRSSIILIRCNRRKSFQQLDLCLRRASSCLLVPQAIVGHRGDVVTVGVFIYFLFLKKFIFCFCF